MAIARTRLVGDCKMAVALPRIVPAWSAIAHGVREPPASSPSSRERSEWWGGWREAPGGGCFRALHAAFVSPINPTRHIDRCALDVTLPHIGGLGLRHAAQLTTASPGTRSNSFVFAVTSVAPDRRACAAIRTS